MSFITGGYALYSGSDSRFVGTAPFLDGGTIYVPLAHLMETFGYTMDYDEQTDTVTIK